MNSHYHFGELRIRFLLECKSVVGGLSNVQLPTKGAKGSKNGTYSLRAAESRRRDHNHERIERSFSHFPIILSKNEFLLLLVLLLLLHSPHVSWRKKKGTPFYKCKLSRTLLQTTKIVGKKGFQHTERVEIEFILFILQNLGFLHPFRNSQGIKKQIVRNYVIV